MNEWDFKIVNCPICQSDECVTRFVISQISIVECSKCSFIYTQKRLKEDKLLGLYKINYFNNNSIGYENYQKEERLRRKNFAKWVNEAIPYLRKPIENNFSLDIGSAAGFCLEEMKRLGFIPEGIELNSAYAEETEKKGFTTYRSPLHMISISKKFQLITLFDVLYQVVHALGC